ncbi:MAG: hypothetical protein ACTSRG_23745 [Candidatus Helarchaeota archaeon]
MADYPLERCEKCDNKLIYLKIKRKSKDKGKVEAICLEGHKQNFDIPIEKKPQWIRLMGSRVLACTVCGGPVVVDRDTLKKDKDKFKFKVKCQAGCNDDKEREVPTELAEAVRRVSVQSRRLGIKPGAKPFQKPGGKPFPRPLGRRFPRRPGIRPKPGMRPKPGVRFEVPEECTKCNAPLNKEQLEALRRNEVVECSFCGSAIKAQRKE